MRKYISREYMQTGKCKVEERPKQTDRGKDDLEREGQTDKESERQRWKEGDRRTENEKI